MSLKTVILKTASIVANVWHPPGATVEIPEEHFEPTIHTPVGWEPAPPAAAEAPAPESAPAPTPGDPTALAAHVRLDALETKVLDLERRLAVVETSTDSVTAPPETTASPIP